jgi:hypothetical protein
MMNKLKELSDWELLSRKKDSPEAFELLFRRHRDYVFRLSVGYCGKFSLADDIVQEVFVLNENNSVSLNIDFVGDRELDAETAQLDEELEQLRDTYSLLKCKSEFDWNRLEDIKEQHKPRSWVLTIMKVAAAVVIIGILLALFVHKAKARRQNSRVSVSMTALPDNISLQIPDMPGSLSMVTEAYISLNRSRIGNDIRYSVPSIESPEQLMKGGDEAKL